jgi:cytosine/adenosine deaminase-related metal-dependent hydrolase
MISDPHRQEVADLIVTGRWVITMDPARRIIEHGAVAVQGDRIVAVGPAGEVRRGFSRAREEIDASGSIVLPGLIDAHAHAGHGLVKTMGYGALGIWEKVIQTVYAHASGPEFWEADARLSALERLKSGVTCGLSILGGYIIRTDERQYGDLHCRAYQESGLRGVLAAGPCAPPFPRSFTRWTGDDRSAITVSFADQLETSRKLVESWNGQAGGRLRTMLFAPLYWPGRSDSSDSLARQFSLQNREMRALSRELGVWITQDNHQAGTVRAACENGFLGPDVLLSHCVDITADEVAMLAETGTKVVHNPAALVSLLGRCPVPELKAAGVTVAIGSDASSPDRGHDMFRHALEAMRIQRRHRRDISFMPPGEALEMITIDAARAIGAESDIGSIEIGKKADIITVGHARPHLAPMNMPVHRLLHYANASDVDNVVVDGRVLMRDRHALLTDEAAILAEAERQFVLAVERAGLQDALHDAGRLWGPAP